MISENIISTCSCNPWQSRLWSSQFFPLMVSLHHFVTLCNILITRVASLALTSLPIPQTNSQLYRNLTSTFSFIVSIACSTPACFDSARAPCYSTFLDCKTCRPRRLVRMSLSTRRMGSQSNHPIMMLFSPSTSQMALPHRYKSDTIIFHGTEHPEDPIFNLRGVIRLQQ